VNLRAGKLPNDLLAELLARIPRRDPRVRVGPGLGRDAAVIDLGDRMLVAKTDPVTFATDRIGWYAVHVNANDIACMGATPRWFLATALLPEGAPSTLPGEIFDQLIQACDALGVELIGGHAEVTPAVTRPVIVGAMLGEAAPNEIVTGANIVPGDVVLMTRAIAIEGTALLARECASRLAAHGVSRDTLARAANFLFSPGISVVADAAIVRRVAAPRLMHDPTEGGIATALYEMAVAANATLRIDVERIAVLDETRDICGALALDPLGLLASGALLAIVSPAEASAVVQALAGAGIACAIIGSVESGAPRVIIGAEDLTVPFPSFERDEVARFFESEDGRSGARAASPEGLNE
jgi:hydrogenase maturation factor